MKKMYNKSSRKEFKKQKNSSLYIEVKDNMSIERAISEFKKRVKNSGLLLELREREYYEKPSVKRRRQRKSRALKLKLLKKD